MRAAHLPNASAEDRAPIPLYQFEKEAREAVLRLKSALPTVWGVSPQWYAVFERTDSVVAYAA